MAKTTQRKPSAKQQVLARYPDAECLMVGETTESFWWCVEDLSGDRLGQPERSERAAWADAARRLRAVSAKGKR